jgi:hypothetical protein
VSKLRDVMPDTVYLGTIEYAVVTKDKKEERQLEVGFKTAKRLIGTKIEEGVEDVAELEHYTRLHLDGDTDAAQTRRGIARDTLKRLLGVEIDDSWETETGYLRLLEDAPNSLIPELVGKEALFRAREYNESIFFDFFSVRPRPKQVATYAELKAKAAKPY